MSDQNFLFYLNFFFRLLIVISSLASCSNNTSQIHVFMRYKARQSTVHNFISTKNCLIYFLVLLFLFHEMFKNIQKAFLCFNIFKYRSFHWFRTNKIVTISSGWHERHLLELWIAFLHWLSKEFSNLRFPFQTFQT